jgi:hypothetical protein
MKSCWLFGGSHTSNAAPFHGVQIRADYFESAVVVLAPVANRNGPREGACDKQCSNGTEGKMHFGVAIAVKKWPQKQSGQRSSNGMGDGKRNSSYGGLEDRCVSRRLVID